MDRLTTLRNHPHISRKTCAPFAVESLESRRLLAGNGLAAAYFNNTDFTSAKLSRNDNQVNFDFTSGAPASGLGSDFSVRWTGRVLARTTEQYRFIAYVAGGVQVWINNTLIINDPTDHALKADSGYFNLTANQRYDVRMEYTTPGNEAAVAKLYWQSNSVAKAIIPKGDWFSSAADSTPPTMPANLRASSVTDSTIRIAWDASSDPSGVVYYDVYIGSSKVATTTDTTYARGGRSPNTSYKFSVQAIDPFGNAKKSQSITTTTLAATQSTRDALTSFSASNFSNSSGVSVSGGNVTSIDDGDYLQYNSVNFHSGVSSVKMTLAVPTSNVGGSFELRLDSTSGTLIGTLVVQPTGSYSTYFTQQTEITGASGIHTLYVIGKNQNGLANLQSLQFSTTALVRIMPLGDSITEEFTGSPSWRYYLYQSLRNDGKSVDFVGTNSTATDGYPPNLDFDQNHEGHSGFTTAQILAALPGYLSANVPDIVLLHLGTNDFRAGDSPQSALDNISQIIDTLRAANPNVKILMAQLIPAADSATETLIESFNAMVPSFVAGETTSQSPITVVDQHTGFDINTDSGDGLHPTTTGDQIMASKWFDALDPLV